MASAPPSLLLPQLAPPHPPLQETISKLLGAGALVAENRLGSKLPASPSIVDFPGMLSDLSRLVKTQQLHTVLLLNVYIPSMVYYLAIQRTKGTVLSSEVVFSDCNTMTQFLKF